MRGDAKDRPDAERALPWFPVVGALVGLAVAGAYAAARSVMPPTLAASIAVGIGVVATGALHEDGLADTADALFGGSTVEERLRILRDPAHGTYGVLAIVLSIVTRVGAIAALSTGSALLVVPAAHALARAAAGGLLILRPARDDGLGASYARAIRAGHVIATAAVAAAVAIAAFGRWAPVVLAAAAIIAWLIGVTSVRRFGGITGDLLGCAEQIAEIAVLLIGVALLHRGLLALPWWR